MCGGKPAKCIAARAPGRAYSQWATDVLPGAEVVRPTSHATQSTVLLTVSLSVPCRPLHRLTARACLVCVEGGASALRGGRERESVCVCAQTRACEAAAQLHSEIHTHGLDDPKAKK